MPTTINGVGTHYYGKRNLEKEQARCEYCRAQVELQSYETGLYFVFFTSRCSRWEKNRFSISVRLATGIM